MQVKVKKIECRAIVEIIDDDGRVTNEDPVSLTIFEVGFDRPVQSIATAAENFVYQKLQADLTNGGN